MRLIHRYQHTHKTRLSSDIHTDTKSPLSLASQRERHPCPATPPSPQGGQPAMRRSPSAFLPLPLHRDQGVPLTCADSQKLAHVDAAPESQTDYQASQIVQQHADAHDRYSLTGHLGRNATPATCSNRLIPFSSVKNLISSSRPPTPLS